MDFENRMPVDSRNEIISKIGYYSLILFVFFRPISLILHKELIGINLLPITVVCLSYMLMIVVFLEVSKIKIDTLDLLILIFCSYVLISALWGSAIGEILSIILPSIVYFGTRLFIDNSNRVKRIMTALSITYIIVLFGNFIFVLLGLSIEKYEFYSQVYRHKGLFLKIHTFAYFLVIYSFIYGYILTSFKNLNKLFKFVLFISLIVSLYCLYKTYTRTAFVGVLLFWLFYLFGQKKKYFVIFIVTLLCGIAVFYSSLGRIFWKTNEYDLNDASSGRLTIWTHNLELFYESSLNVKLLGAGLGNKIGGAVIGDDDQIWASHSNFLGLLMGTGLVGLSIYLSIIIVLFWITTKKKLTNQKKWFYYGILTSVTVMNSLSNAFILRVECSQMFWLFIGLIYVNDISVNRFKLSKDY